MDLNGSNFAFRGRLPLVVAMAALAAITVQAQSGAVMTIQAGQPGAIISSNLFGIFFEEINFAGEGGLYAEMVRNRSFYTATNANYWTLVTQGTATGIMRVDTSRPLNTNIPNSLKLTMQSGAGSVGAGNSGFWGMSLHCSRTRHFTVELTDYARTWRTGWRRCIRHSCAFRAAILSKAIILPTRSAGKKPSATSRSDRVT